MVEARRRACRRAEFKTFGLLPGTMRGLPFDRKVEVLLEGRSDVAPIVRPMLVAWRRLRVQVAAFEAPRPAFS
jgi:transposase